MRDPTTDDVARWFALALRELLAGPVTQAVIVPVDDESEFNYGARERIRLEPFACADVAAYLGRVALGVAEEVWKWSGGYPFAIAAAEAAATSATDAGALKSALEEPAPSVAATVRRIVAEVAGEDTARRTLVELAGVLHRFDESILLVLLADLRIAPPDDIAFLLPRLPFATRDGEGYRLHEFARQAIAYDLAHHRGTGRLEELHKKALDYFKERLREDAKDRGGRYDSWARYQESEGQALILEFIYHQTHVDDRPWARNEFATIFFDAFWWWGGFLPSKFCAELLAKWEHETTSDADTNFLPNLRAFDAAYPRPSGGDASRALEALVAVCDDSASPPGRSRRPKRRHLSGVVSLLITACLVELAPKDREIDRQLAHANDCFAENAEERRRSQSGRRVEDDAWCMPWVRQYQAYVARARGNLREAQAHAEEAIALAGAAAEQDRDHEVVANCAEIWGDVCFRSDDPDGAFRCYARAIVSALAFQTRPCPDDYTRAYYDDLADRIVDRARTLAAKDVREAAAACTELHRFWQPAWDERRATVPPRFEELLRYTSYGERRLREVLLPPAPPPAGQPGQAAYIDRAASVYRRLRDDVLPAARVPRRRAVREDRAVDLAAFLAADDPAWPGWWKDEAIPRPWEGVDSARLQRSLEQEVARLPEPLRTIVRRRDIEGRSAREVEQEFGLSETDQLVKLHQARARIRDALEAELRRP